jgi:hypothetical protein
MEARHVLASKVGIFPITPDDSVHNAAKVNSAMTSHAPQFALTSFHEGKGTRYGVCDDRLKIRVFIHLLSSCQFVLIIYISKVT